MGLASVADLVNVFAAAIDAEVAVIQESESANSFELRTGERQESSFSAGGLFVFHLPDEITVPDDSAGVLRIDGSEFPATVVSQQGSQLWILVDGTKDLPAYVPRALLIVSATKLLERLKEVLEGNLADNPGLAPQVFGISPATLGTKSWSPDVELDRSDSRVTEAIEQSLGSQVTYIWGPPGTGKTYTIAALLACLLADDERVLVTSHTHAAVEQALWAAVEPVSQTRQGGSLHGSSLVAEGGLLKVGPMRDPKIPRTCHLASVVEDRGAELQAELQQTVGRLAALEDEEDRARGALECWLRLSRVQRHLLKAQEHLQLSLQSQSVARDAIERWDWEVKRAHQETERAQSSFAIGRQGRVTRGRARWLQACELFAQAQAALASADDERLRAQSEMGRAVAGVDAAHEAVVGLPRRHHIERTLEEASAERRVLESRSRQIREALDVLATQVLDEARGIFVTLTKLYVDPVIRDRTWDTVIVDEVSVAMLPLIALAASRATKRVVLVGDFYQLPPVVRSREGIGREMLGTDIFDWHGWIPQIDRGVLPKAVKRLAVQRRMHPHISRVAQTLVPYELEDHPSVRAREAPPWTAALKSANPLMFVDTADLSPWSGRVQGGSRFNLYSAQVSVELASLCAASLERPETGEPAPIGIVTPYRAQLRYLSKLIEGLGLSPWVAAGTVHTFQGSECDLIVFDSVVGEPHWTARFTNPHDYPEVRRDLNVAVTRARHQFVFVGDADWLARHAHAGSGFHRMIGCLEGFGTRIKATDLLAAFVHERVALGSESSGWSADAIRDEVALMTEKAFYPSLQADLAKAKSQVVLFTPFVGKQRWPQVAPWVSAAAERGLEVVVLHKPFSENPDPRFVAEAMKGLQAVGAHTIEVVGVHAKTILIDGHIVYEGSLNWASQVASYEHMLRVDSVEFFALYEQLIQVEKVMTQVRSHSRWATNCPKCGGPLQLVNMRENPRGRPWSGHAIAFGCARYYTDKSCEGYLRVLDRRPPFDEPPMCTIGSRMELKYDKRGRPYRWVCEHKSCDHPRYQLGDVEP